MRFNEGPGIDAVLDGALQMLTNGANSLLGPSVVRDAGHEPFFEDEHFQPGQSIPYNMNRGAEADCTIAVWSPAYFESEHCVAELNAAVMESPLGLKGKLIPVRVAPVDIPLLYAQLAYLDVVGVDDDIARQRILAALLKHGQLDVTRLSLVGRTRRVVERADRNRKAMIEKIRTIWITGFLHKSLFHETRVVLGLTERPDAVAQPFDLLVMSSDQGEHPLPPGTNVVDVFDTMNQSLLILGAPGSGKTTLLLELAGDLLDRADRDTAQPIPVVFPLSTWSESRKPMFEWLKDELNLRYDVPRALAAEWVETDQILPLLDGLDEVPAAYRAACIVMINKFRQQRGFVPLVVTGRVAEYEAEDVRLRLHAAILVRPLTREQVRNYLAALGEAGESVAEAVLVDPSLWELLDTPLMLNIFTLANARAPAPSTPWQTASARRDYVFNSYVDYMLRHTSSQDIGTCQLRQSDVWRGWRTR